MDENVEKVNLLLFQVDWLVFSGIISIVSNVVSLKLCKQIKTKQNEDYHLPGLL